MAQRERMMMVRAERAQDAAAVREVNLAAFDGPAEADLVDALRTNCDDSLSLVAVDAGRVVGHALFSPVFIETASGRAEGMGLGPVAVLPERQRQGIGTALLEAGIAELRQRGCPFVIVLGHPAYYGRFGFTPAIDRGVHCEWDVPTEAFMILVLDEAALAGVAGIARYCPEFASVL